MILGPDGTRATPPDCGEPLADGAVEFLLEHAAGFTWDPERAGVDVLCSNATATGPNRARIKIFSPRARTAVVFLYKDSQVPFSTDRFAYGMLVAKGRPPDREELRQVVAYALAGLDPRRRPACLKRALPFDVPR